jgi:hypothetical protein
MYNFNKHDYFSFHISFQSILISIESYEKFNNLSLDPSLYMLQFITLKFTTTIIGTFELFWVKTQLGGLFGLSKL